jgi:hypothetical protein
MSINLRGETITMAYSSSFLDKWNKEKEQFTITNADNSSSNYIDLENILKDEKESISHQTAAEPYQVSNKNKLPRAQKKRKKTSNNLTIQEENVHFNQERMFNSSNSTAESLNRIEAKDESIEGKEFLRSKQLAQPIRSNLQTESMSNNLRGETILMAYSSSFLDNKKITEEKLTTEPNTNNSLSNKVNLGKILQWKKECIKQPTEAEPKRIINNLKVQGKERNTGIRTNPKTTQRRNKTNSIKKKVLITQAINFIC